MSRRTRTNPESRCPACLKSLDGATAPDGSATPEPGDLSVCVYCSTLLVFQTDLTLRAMRQYELDELAPEEASTLLRIRIIVQALRAVKEMQ